ncbi:MAG TPA: hypothetical protein DDZ81_19215 [Acetobacteraceae bacterium]|jgi:probable HAF family extracellular repeat protein|nr:hypothetical protein [Acetobacteraceae bacterium]
MSVASSDNTVIASSNGMITDAVGNQWTIQNGQVAVNGIVDETTASVVLLAYENGAVWQENADELWWSKTDPASQWFPPDGTTVSPVPTAPISIQVFDLPVFFPHNLKENLGLLKMNDQGDMIGVAGMSAGGRSQGVMLFLYQGGVFTQSLATGITPNGINDSGQIISTQGLVNRTGGITPITAPSGEIVSITAENNQDQLIGTYGAPGSPSLQGFIEKDGIFTTIGDPQGLGTTTPSAVNDLGQVIGWYWDRNNIAHGFLYNNGAYTTIDIPDTNTIFVSSNGISDSGELVGSYTTAVGSQAIAHGFIDIGGNIQTFDVPGATQTVIDGVNNAGQIFGAFTDATGQHGFVASPTTSPSSPQLPGQGIAAIDTTTGKAMAVIPQFYSGPVNGLAADYITTTPDSLNITLTTPNWFIHSGGGNDAITASSGTNVLDGSSGSNFLTGGSGSDTFFVDQRGLSSDIWTTLNNFHSGDSAAIWGVNQGDFTLAWQDGRGTAGYTGLTLGITRPETPDANVTLAGWTNADLTNGKLTMSYGTIPSPIGGAGTTYMLIHAT